MAGERARARHPAPASWMRSTRLDPMSGAAAHQGDPRVIEAREKVKRWGAAAAANLQRLLA